MENLNASRLTDLAYGINGAGGGGNLRELYNPTGEENIGGLVQELGKKEAVPLVTHNNLSPQATICSIARLGKPGAKADQYAVEVSQALVRGLEELCSNLNMSFPQAIFPVEATAGQMARAVRAARAANVAILDGDVCGGIAVPAVPLAFNIHQALRKFPDIALIELIEKKGIIVPQITLMKEENPQNLEQELRKKAASAPFGAVWFAWLLCTASDFKNFFTPGSISSSIIRGRIVKQAIKESVHPAQALLKAGEIERIIAQGVVLEVTDENVPGFAQFTYVIQTSEENLIMAARNEYIVVYTDKNGEVIARAPQIINVIGKNGPIQSHVLKPGDTITIVVAQPQCLINNPRAEADWRRIWQEYWEKEKKRNTWPHPY